MPANSDEAQRSISLLLHKANVLEAEAARCKEIEPAPHLREQEPADIDLRKNEFLAMLCHELRNPLMPIMIAFELMRIKLFVSTQQKGHP